MSNPGANETALVGWQGEANIRGTYEILRSCIGTIVLLCWSSVCPNVPPLGGGAWSKIQGKLSLFLLAILMPEAVLWVAVGQLHRAWLDKNAFKARSSSGWGLRECFFVNMGGLFIQFLGPDSSEASTAHQRPFPVNCTQLRYLADNGFLELPRIKPEEIEMRNKSNGLARTITIGQVLWFTISTLARIAQGLPITTLELTTLSLVLIMVFSAAAWWRKPMDISHPMIIQSNVCLSTVLENMMDPPNPRSRNFGATPLAFYDRQEWVLSKAWASYTCILRTLCYGTQSPTTGEGESNSVFPNTFPSIELLQVALTLEALGGLLTQVYSCVLLSAWNAYFPTPTESLLWRVSTVVGVSYGFLGCAIAVLDRYGACISQCYHNIWRSLRKAASGGTDTEPQIPLIEGSTTGRKKRGSWLDWLRRFSNLSPNHDPNFDMKLRVWVPATLLCMIYSFARVFIIIEDFISLRRQPSSTYEVVNWAQYSILL